MSFELRGQAAMKRRIEALAKRYPDAVKVALYAEAEGVATVVKQRYVPRDDGDLMNSIHVPPPEREGDDIIVKIVAGGSAAAHALPVHEHPSEHSPPSWQGKEPGDILSVRGRKPWVAEGEGRGPKFLQRGLRSRLRGMRGRIQARVTAALGSTGGGQS